MIQAAVDHEINAWGKPRKVLSEHLRLIDRERTCERCGVTGNPKQIHTHHRNGNHRDNRPLNLVYLCRRCHKQAHRESGPGKSYHAPLSGENFRNLEIRIDTKYRKPGGSKGLRKALGSRETQTSIAKRFGVTRERVRQWAVELGFPRRNGPLGVRDLWKEYGPPFKREKRYFRPERLYKQIRRASDYQSWTHWRVRLYAECYFRDIPEDYLHDVAKIARTDKRDVHRGDVPVTRKMAEIISAAMENALTPEEILLACGEQL